MVTAGDITAALDGSKKATAEREHEKELVIKSESRQLGHYAEENCKDHNADAPRK